MSELTHAERRWIRELQKVLNKCPSERIGFFTTGDCDIKLFDKTKESEIAARQDRGADFGPAAEAVGARFDGDLLFPSNVYSTAG